MTDCSNGQTGEPHAPLLQRPQAAPPAREELTSWKLWPDSPAALRRPLTSNSSGMRLAKRWMLSPGLMFLPPTLTAASTMKAWPSCTPAAPCRAGAGGERDATHSSKGRASKQAALSVLPYPAAHALPASNQPESVATMTCGMDDNKKSTCLVCGHHLRPQLLHDAQPQVVLACTARTAGTAGTAGGWVPPKGGRGSECMHVQSNPARRRPQQAMTSSRQAPRAIGQIDNLPHPLGSGGCRRAGQSAAGAASRAAPQSERGGAVGAAGLSATAQELRWRAVLCKRQVRSESVWTTQAKQPTCFGVRSAGAVEGSHRTSATIRSAAGRQT